MTSDITQAGRNRADGFSLIELMIVLLIAGIVVALALPSGTNLLRGFQLRGAAAGLEALIQDTRMRSVRDDAVYSTAAVTLNNGQTGFCVVNLNALLNGVNVTANDCGTLGEQIYQLPANVQVIPEANAPAIVPVNGNYIQDDAASPAGAPNRITFNARGLPCLYSIAAPCSTLPGGTQIGFVYYLVTQAARGSTIYRAVTVTPAGRVRLWAYQQGGGWQ